MGSSDLRTVPSPSRHDRFGFLPSLLRHSMYFLHHSKSPSVQCILADASKWCRVIIFSLGPVLFAVKRSIETGRYDPRESQRRFGAHHAAGGGFDAGAQCFIAAFPSQVSFSLGFKGAHRGACLGLTSRSATATIKPPRSRQAAPGTGSDIGHLWRVVTSTLACCRRSATGRGMSAGQPAAYHMW